MVKRVLTSIVGLPLMILVVVTGGNLLLFSVFLLAVIGMKEMFNALSLDKKPVHYLAYIFLVIYYMLIGNLVIPFLIINQFGVFLFSLYALFIISIMVALVIFHNKINIIDCSIVLFCLMYVGFLMSFIYLVRQHSYGHIFVWLIFISAWGCDTGAYFVGKTIGKHKLTPLLSPNKTVEGAIGGVASAALIACIYGMVVSNFLLSHDIDIIVFCIIISIVGAIFSQFGDLSASAIKRFTKIKDFGKIIPGHGGIIDRFDSILFTAPIVYIVMTLLLRFIK